MKFIEALEKSTNTILIEATYEVKEIVDDLYKKIKIFINKPVSLYNLNRVVQTINITSNLKKFIKKYNLDNKKRIYLELRFTGTAKVIASILYVHHPTIKLKIPIDFKEKINQEEIKAKLEHEIIHAIDAIRSPGQTQSLTKKYHKTAGGYFRMPNEFNAVIHEIKNMASSEKYDEISSKKEFIRFLKNSNQYIFKQFAKLLDENPSWYKKLITRLNRERLIPAQLDLVESTSDLSKLSAEDICDAGKKQKNFDFKKGLDALIKKDIDGGFIFDAGTDWKHFDFKKGLDALIEKDKNGKWICEAGKLWEKFDYDKGLDALIKKDANGEYIYDAGIGWKKFSFNKGLKALKALKIIYNDFYKHALRDWPKGIKQSQKISKEIKSKAKTLSMKKLKLKENVAEDVFKTQGDSLVKLSNLFTYKKEISSDEFLDYLDKNAERLKKNSRSGLGQMIYITGLNAYRKRMDFNYDKGLDLLLKYDKEGTYIVDAGSGKEDVIVGGWPRFNYTKALKALKKVSNKRYYDYALKTWPKDIKASIERTKDIKSKAKTLPMKKLKLKEEWAKIIKKKIDIFKNPSQKEIMEVVKHAEDEDFGSFFRYIALPNKTLYVFSGAFTHSEVLSGLRINPKEFYIGGLAEKVKGGWETKSMHNVELGSAELLEKVLKKDWSWLLEKYNIKTKKELENRRKKRDSRGCYYS